MTVQSRAEPEGCDAAGLHVAHVVATESFAGVERYVANVSRSLAHRGAEVTVICGAPDEMRHVVGRSDVSIVRAADPARIAHHLITHARAFDVVHVHMTSAEIAMLVASPFLRCPVVATRHFARRRGSTAGARAVAPLVRARLDAQISISRFVADAIGEPSDVLLNSVPDATAADPVASVVLVAQRLESEKHTGEALTAWQRSELAADGWQLWLAGDGAQRAELEHLVAADRIPGVRFLGHRPDLDAVRRKVGVLLATAPHEPFGLSVAEAMASGLPVVASAGGGHLETIGAVRPDLLFPPGDIDTCANLLRRLAADVDTRRRAGAELRNHQQSHLGMDRHIDGLVAIYKRVMASRPPRALSRTS